MIHSWEEGKRTTAITKCLDALKKGKGWGLTLNHTTTDYDGMMLWLIFKFNTKDGIDVELIKVWISWLDLVGLVHKNRYSDAEFGDYEGKPEYIKVCKKVIKRIYEEVKNFIKDNPDVI